MANVSGSQGNSAEAAAQDHSPVVYVIEDASDLDTPAASDPKETVEDSEWEVTEISPGGDTLGSGSLLTQRANDKEGVRTTMPQSKQTFYFDLPTMSEKEKAKFGFMAGHFTVRRIVAEYTGGRFLVKLESGEKQLEALEDESDLPLRKRGRPKAYTDSTSGRQTRSQDSDFSPQREAPTRRSERNKEKQKRDMREKLEDEIDFFSGGEAAAKVVGTKETFVPLSKDNPFRRRHRSECDTCHQRDDDPLKGRMVYCQGCTSSYHRQCLGYRGTRLHLVTKVGEGDFVLQCRRCIGMAHEKIETAPHQGVCTTCNKPGPMSQPLRRRLTTKQEQQQREENGGQDPITIVDKALLNNGKNVLFRCALCQRAWHMHHLPVLDTTGSQTDEGEETRDDEQIAQKRFELHRRSWSCKDCTEHQSQIDVIVAWRPVDLDSYTPGTASEMLPESQKEYLIKWRHSSYQRVSWMPGPWVWGVAASAMRAAFNKKPENKLPRLTTEDAIPEDWFHPDIVFDVEYSSNVPNSSQEIEMGRAKDVTSAYIKYKGLGYEDAIWEKPPSDQDGERWEDFRVAYEDYVLKLHTHIPNQSALRRHLATIRTYDFESKLLRKKQPSLLTGGELMEYQMEGLNWLYYQWYSNQNAILADEMGLGKTIQLVAFFSLLVEEHKCWPFLVVVPNSTCPNWRREIKKWAPSLRAVCYYGSSTARKLTHDYELFPRDDQDGHRTTAGRKSGPKDIRAHVVIASYESMVEEKTRQSLMRVPWQGLIVDEGQRLKNDKNLLYEGLSKVEFPFKVLLTGTPLQNNIRELFNIIQFLDKSVDAAEMEARYETLTQENVPELHAQLHKFLLRRTKAKVLAMLPPMAQIIVPVTMTPLQKKLYRSILAKNPALMKSIFSRHGVVASKERVNLNGILVQLRKTLCHPFVYSRQIEERSADLSVAHRSLVEASPKLQLLSIMLPKLRERGHRVLLFSQFLDNLDIVEDFLDGLGLQHRRLDGSMSSLEKQKKIDEFNAPNSPIFAFLLSTRAGGVGINLATADTVIILDPDFNPHQDIQALSRAHRIGQKNKVLVFQLVTKETVEEKILQIGKKKMALDHALIDTMERNNEDAVDLESILRHGAEALFQEDESQEDIVYDSAAVDSLLDRSQVEDTKASEDKSAESQFSFARVWSNKTAALEDTLGEESASEGHTPNPGIWDKILQERERAFAEEAARNAEALGRGKRKRANVDYGDDGLGELKQRAEKKKNRKKERDEHGSDTDFQADAHEDEDVAEEYESVDESDSEDREATRQALLVKPFVRAKIPAGPVPYYNMDGSAAYNDTTVPPVHQCPACGEVHPLGWCRIKLAGVEHCGLCGVAHLGHSRTCPNLNSEHEVLMLLESLKESTEPWEIVESAVGYLRAIRADLAQRRRLAQKKTLAQAGPARPQSLHRHL
ncbi:hypothetical protein DV735_g2779, partial [Chaetothyriales sp. CBS 134920]